MKIKQTCVLWAVVACSLGSALAAPSPGTNSYARQVDQRIEALGSQSAPVAAGAAEALGFLRAYGAADALAQAATHKEPTVRREAVMALGFCGSRKHVAPLLAALDDDDWTVRQGAWVALTNITGMEMPFNALAPAPARRAQAAAWQAWWAKVPADRPPAELLAALGPLPTLPTPPPVPAAPQKGKSVNLALRRPVTVSSTYRGPAGVLTDGKVIGGFWQTKNVAFPQQCTVDLGKPQQVGCVVVYQYDNASMHMRDFSISTGDDGKQFVEVFRRKAATGMRAVATFEPRKTRYVRLTSFATGTRTYPTTLHEIELYAKTAPPASVALTRRALSDSTAGDDHRIERALRALGALGGAGAADALAAAMAPYAARSGKTFSQKTLVQVGLRALGRQGGDRAYDVLASFLDNPQWARYAADALGDLGDRRAIAALTAAYPQYGRDLTGKRPKAVPRDDRPGLDPRDRMYETPYAIAQALSRLDISAGPDVVALRGIVPLVLANMPTDFDGAMLYEPEAYHLVTADLLERAGLRAAAMDAALTSLGRPRKIPDVPEATVLAALARRMAADEPYGVIWLLAFSRTPADAKDLIALLDHENGWVRINAAKGLMFMSHRAAAGPIAKLLAASKGEAEFGYFGKFMFRTGKQGQAEYNDPCPRWREAMVRALGRLGGGEHVKLLVKLLHDERSVLDIRHAAAVALDEIGTDEAIAALKQTAMTHVFYSIQLVAREALWRRGIAIDAPVVPPAAPLAASQENSAKPQAVEAGLPDRGIVFITGDNSMPNDFQIDIWRQTYSTTDSGPTYRLGTNLCVLRPPKPDGKVTPLTHFTDGYVADCEVSWDGKRVLFARRGGDDDPWWHICEIGADGKGFRQITRGPYHDVQPTYLPDGRIVFASSRIGMRDEYHGYYATGLTIMNADGSDIHCIGFNLGRDNEPAILPDGRIAFSRLELFYSRLKTEITIHAANPDGTRDVTLYGPEWRDFWKQQTRLAKEGGWGEVAPRHRVLRLTQVQPVGRGRLICATTGGATIVGPGRYRHTLLPRDGDRAVTTPWPLPDGRILCAATVRTRKRNEVDLGLYTMDATTGKLTLVYNDPAAAEFEARPLAARPKPPVLYSDPRARSGAYTGTLFCSSVRITQHESVKQRGKMVRVVEGMPAIARHQTHRAKEQAWKNHTGTHARVLGTVPLAADGSFHVEVPADRLIHVQVLDSDRRVVGNQQIWMYVRPGETRSCIGCHERPDATMLPTHRALVQGPAPVKCLPTGGEFSYRAKFWNKGTLSDEGEERVRTVRAVSLIGRQ